MEQDDQPSAGDWMDGPHWGIYFDNVLILHVVSEERAKELLPGKQWLCVNGETLSIKAIGPGGSWIGPASGVG